MGEKSHRKKHQWEDIQQNEYLKRANGGAASNARLKQRRSNKESYTRRFDRDRLLLGAAIEHCVHALLALAFTSQQISNKAH